jgi:hypothetical protein
MAQIELGDTLGFDTVWLGELHFSRGFQRRAELKGLPGARPAWVERRLAAPAG